MRRYFFLASALLAASSFAIEAPQPTTPGPAQPAAPVQTSVTPSDESAFYQVLQTSAHHRNLTGLKIPPDVIRPLARGDAAAAIAMLSKQAAAGNNDENIALVRIQHWCNRISSARLPEAKAQIAQLPPVLSPERAARAAGVIVADEKYRQVVRESCSRARFDFQAIEGRLREAADAGDAASATELAQFTRDPARRQAMLKAAADKGFAPAQYALATGLLMAVQRGDTTENVSSIRLLFKQSGRSLNKAKIDLANCMAVGCDGHPADAPQAAAFGMDAARDGEPGAFLSMARMPWGRRLTRSQLLAWQYFGDRLSEAGCVGEGYVMSTINFDQTIKALEARQDVKFLEEARAQADTLWRDNGERAKREQGCARATPSA
ncbi:MAG TPA: hypothetical protein VNA21_06955 [Steroidobacteraceae bacterium]|nr:hypothetical protein [Steroidobacteraceae bacterium]